MEDKKPQPSFYANIPATVRYDKNLCANAKLLYGEITALTNKNGYAWAGNEYFAELYDVSLKTVSRWISQLESEGYIKRVMIYKENSKEIKQRHIYLNQTGVDKNDNTSGDKNENTYGQKCPQGGDKIAEDNNTLINNTLINNIKDNVQSEIEQSFDEFWKFYPRKESKKKAKDIYTKIIKAGKYDHEHIMNGLMLYLDYIKATNTQSSFMAHPTTYLNQERFNDELVIPTKQYNEQKTFRFGEVAYGQETNGNGVGFNRFNVSGQIEG